jgi:transcriptional regulator with XRE-family HTH domain
MDVWDMNIGRNIRQLRKLHNMSQSEFSGRIGISQGNLSEIEQGNCNPSLVTLSAIKNAFNCSVDELISVEFVKGNSLLAVERK